MNMKCRIGIHEKRAHGQIVRRQGLRRGFGGGGGFRGRGFGGGGNGFLGGLILGSLMNGNRGSSRPPVSHIPTPAQGPNYKPSNTGAPNANGGKGCGTVVIGAIVVVFVLLLIVAITSGSCSSSSVAKSTIEREALPASATTETAYYTDADGGWIGNASQLESGMRHFYEETGVQPYLYILPNGTVASSDDLAGYAEELYGRGDAHEASR